MIVQSNLNYLAKVLDVFNSGIVGTIANASQIELIFGNESVIDFRDFDIRYFIFPFEELNRVL